MILSKPDLIERLPELIATDQRDYEMVNPASIDIRVGGRILTEGGADRHLDIMIDQEYWMDPGEFLLVSTYEYITVPHDLVVEMRLKSSIARQGFDHSLAFWVDPGWRGILTMEVQNANRHRRTCLKYGMRFAQLIVHQLSTAVEEGYSGRYQGATSVEAAK